MKEKLISLETAILAKEVGCNLTRCECGGFPECICEENDKLRITQSLLQKWLREVHQLHITIYSCSQESWMSRITRPGQKLEHGIYGEDYNTYEDALEDSLYMALKTIK